MTARQSLRDRLAAARAANYVDLVAPPEIGLFVRCRALTSGEIADAWERNRKHQEPGVQAAIDSLVTSCIGIWEEVDGKGASPIDGFSGVIDLQTGHLSGDLPTFSTPALADAFGVEDGTAEALVRAVLAPTSDAVFMGYSDALSNFSTKAEHQFVRDAPGN